MRLKGLCAALVVALGASAALAGPASGKGKPPTTGAGCKPQVSLIIKGTATGDASASQVTLNVNGGNSFANKLFANDTTTTTTVNTTASTEVVSGGNPSSLTSIEKSDHVLAQYRVCKADVTGKTAGQLSTLLASLTPKKVAELG